MASAREPLGDLLRDAAAPTITVSGAIAALAVLYLAAYPIYALYLHPLSGYPGHWLTAITRVPFWLACVRGRQVAWMRKQHEKYGPTVRFGPDDLSFTDAQAWRDICVTPKGKKENGKELRFHGPPPEGARHVFLEPDVARHATVRRVFAPAFAEKALRKQEPLFRKYADLMVACARRGGTVNMTELFDFATFDIMAEFTFGESLGLLENNKYSDWVAMVFSAVRVSQSPSVCKIERPKSW